MGFCRMGRVIPRKGFFTDPFPFLGCLPVRRGSCGSSFGDLYVSIRPIILSVPLSKHILMCSSDGYDEMCFRKLFQGRFDGLKIRLLGRFSMDYPPTTGCRQLGKAKPPLVNAGTRKPENPAAGQQKSHFSGMEYRGFCLNFSTCMPSIISTSSGQRIKGADMPPDGGPKVSFSSLL